MSTSRFSSYYQQSINKTLVMRIAEFESKRKLFFFATSLVNVYEQRRRIHISIIIGSQHVQQIWSQSKKSLKQCHDWFHSNSLLLSSLWHCPNMSQNWRNSISELCEWHFRKVPNMTFASLFIIFDERCCQHLWFFLNYDLLNFHQGHGCMQFNVVTPLFKWKAISSCLRPKLSFVADVLSLTQLMQQWPNSIKLIEEWFPDLTNSAWSIASLTY